MLDQLRARCFVFGMNSPVAYKTFSVLCIFGKDRWGSPVGKWLEVVACDIDAAKADISEAFASVEFVTYSVK